MSKPCKLGGQVLGGPKWCGMRIPHENFLLKKNECILGCWSWTPKESSNTKFKGVCDVEFSFRMTIWLWISRPEFALFSWDFGFSPKKHWVLIKPNFVMWFSNSASLPGILQTKPRHSPGFCRTNHVTPWDLANQTTSPPDFCGPNHVTPRILQTKPRHSRGFCRPNHVTPRFLWAKPFPEILPYPVISRNLIDPESEPCHSLIWLAQNFFWPKKSHPPKKNINPNIHALLLTKFNTPLIELKS